MLLFYILLAIIAVGVLLASTAGIALLSIVLMALIILVMLVVLVGLSIGIPLFLVATLRDFFIPALFILGGFFILYPLAMILKNKKKRTVSWKKIKESYKLNKFSYLVSGGFASIVILIWIIDFFIYIFHKLL